VLGYAGVDGSSDLLAGVDPVAAVGQVHGEGVPRRDVADGPHSNFTSGGKVSGPVTIGARV